MNSVTLAGRLAQEPKVIKGNNGDFVKITIACKVSKDKTDFIDCLAFRKTAEFITKYLNTGDFVHCQGKISKTKSINKQNQTTYATNIVVKNIDVLTKSKKSISIQVNQNQKVPFINEKTLYEVNDTMMTLGYSKEEIEHGIYKLLDKDKYNESSEDIVADLIPKINVFNKERDKKLDNLSFYEEELDEQDEELVDINALEQTDEEELELK